MDYKQLRIYMKYINMIVVAVLLSVNNLYAIDGGQKSDDFGYHNTTEVKDNSIFTLTEVRDIRINKNSDELSTASNNAVQPASKVEVETKATVEKVGTIDHSAFDALLKAHVSDAGKVDYAAIKSDISKLDKYLGYLSQNVPGANQSSNEQLAFWINAYNANTIKLIVDNYPVNSIMNLYDGKAFDKKWITLGGESLSLNDIENNKIRAKFNEPRIHFAVNCAAESCPPILNKAWTADNLEANLESRATAFINNEAYNKISKDAVQISKIFEWYAKDFPGNIVEYLNKYSKTKIANGAQVSYKEYNWDLNSK